MIDLLLLSTSELLSTFKIETVASVLVTIRKGDIVLHRSKRCFLLYTHLFLLCTHLYLIFNSYWGLRSTRSKTHGFEEGCHQSHLEVYAFPPFALIRVFSHVAVLDCCHNAISMATERMISRPSVPASGGAPSTSMFWNFLVHSSHC